MWRRKWKMELRRAEGRIAKRRKKKEGGIAWRVVVAF